jgi:hypothetical protein
MALLQRVEQDQAPEVQSFRRLPSCPEALYCDDGGGVVTTTLYQSLVSGTEWRKWIVLVCSQEIRVIACQVLLPRAAKRPVWKVTPLYCLIVLLLASALGALKIYWDDNSTCGSLLSLCIRDFPSRTDQTLCSFFICQFSVEAFVCRPPLVYFVFSFNCFRFCSMLTIGSSSFRITATNSLTATRNYHPKYHAFVILMFVGPPRSLALYARLRGLSWLIGHGRLNHETSGR